MRKSLGMFDCVVIGGGPAGLLCAIYLARFRRNVIIFDNKLSRARLIPHSHNYPGSVQGISGSDILLNLKKQAKKYAVKIKQDTIIEVKKNKNQLFKIIGEKFNCESQTIVLATGMTDVQPDIAFEKEKIKKGLLRHCIICDGYEIIDKNIAVLVKGKHGFDKTILLQTYTKNITVFLNKTLSASLKKQFKQKNIKIVDSPIANIAAKGKKMGITLADGKEWLFDGVYCALGSLANTALAKSLKLKCGKNVCIKTDKHQRTSAKGCYAIGDVVDCLDQMATGFGHAAIAATDINNLLIRKSNSG